MRAPSIGTDGRISESRQPAADSPTQRPPSSAAVDGDGQAWLAALRGDGSRREEALARLHGLLLRAARFEVARRARTLRHLRGNELDDIALQSADDALVAVLAKLDRFRGESRFTTWAYKFALLEASVKVRRRAWQGREVPLEPERWPRLADHGASPQANAEQGELLSEVRDAIESELTPHQREVFAALALNEVPIDVLAERLGTSRGALYKTLHDARRKLRRAVEARGHHVGSTKKEGTPQ
jgi:RNA polymerase sigma-70 factor, ECF subfamily